jgi:DnaJ-class molecular chaperone
MKDYYKILEVNENASKEIIERTYRVLIKKYHPDLYIGEERNQMNTKIREINEAYKILSDDFLREQYNNEWNKEKAEYYKNKYGNYANTNANSVETEYNNNARIRKNQNRNQYSNNKFKEGKKFINNIENKSGMIAVIKEVFKKRSNKFNIKNITKTDMIAVVITIICIIIIGVILWFLPFTNWWMRQLIFENPLFSWIWS